MKKMSGVITKMTLVLLIGLGGTVSTAWSDVILQLPEDTKIMAINGESGNVWGDVHLPDGINQIAVRLQIVFNRRGFRGHACGILRRFCPQVQGVRRYFGHADPSDQKCL